MDYKTYKNEKERSYNEGTDWYFLIDEQYPRFAERYVFEKKYKFKVFNK
ncbi:hypothetical protein [Flavobacterium franklandianum]|nr:hypothetical protein [Flavobacterium franklandianum]